MTSSDTHDTKYFQNPMRHKGEMLLTQIIRYWSLDNEYFEIHGLCLDSNAAKHILYKWSTNPRKGSRHMATTMSIEDP